MKKLSILSLSFFVLFVLISCSKKSTPSPLGTITATINGSAQTFNTRAAAHLLVASRLYSLSIVGYTDATASSNSIIMVVTNNGFPITAVPYFGDDVTSGISYMLGNPMVSYGFTSKYNNNTMINIKSISNTEVKGTFSASLVQLVGTGGPTNITLTNGTFDLPIN